MLNTLAIAAAVVAYLAFIVGFARFAGPLRVLRLVLLPNLALLWLVLVVVGYVQLVHPPMWADLVHDMKRRPTHQLAVCGVFASCVFTMCLYYLSSYSSSPRIRSWTSWMVGDAAPPKSM